MFKKIAAIGLCLLFVSFGVSGVAKAKPLDIVESKHINAMQGYGHSFLSRSRDFEIEGTVSIDNVIMQQQYLDKVPISIRNKFFSNGGCMILTAEDIATKIGSPEWEGMILGAQNGNTILIHASSRAISRSTVHEWGHYFDYKLGRVSNSREFRWLYEKNRGRWIYMYGRASSDEFFAESFQQMILYPEEFIKRYPGIYYYILNYINAFE